MSTLGPLPAASTALECSTVTRSVLIIWVGRALVARVASRPSRCRCSAAFGCTVPSKRSNFAYTASRASCNWSGCGAVSGASARNNPLS